MKKKLSLLLAAAMVVGMLPVSAFAKTENSVSKVKSVAVNDVFDTTLEMELKTSMATDDEFQLKLTGAEWNNTSFSAILNDGTTGEKNLPTTVKKVTDKIINVKLGASAMIGDVITIPVEAKAKDKGVSEITVSQIDSVVSEGTYSIANIASGSVTATIEKTTDITDDWMKVKPIILTETSAGAFETGEIKVKLGGDFDFKPGTYAPTLECVAGSQGTLAITFNATKSDDTTLYFNVTGASTKATMWKIDNLYVAADEDDADFGDVADFTVSGAGIDKVSLDAAKYVDYNVNFTAFEDEDLPVMVAGKVENDDETIKVKIKESLAGSLITNRKSEIVFPDGVEITDVNISSNDSENVTISGITTTLDDNKVKLTVASGSIPTDKKATIVMDFDLSVEAGFSGDIVATFKTAGCEDQEVTVATAVAPFTVSTEKNEVKIDYRNVAINDIIITETQPGAIDKDFEIQLEADEMQFEDDMEYEVTSGDLKVDDLDVTDGVITIKIDSESSKTAGVIKLSNVQLYLNRSLPTGDYALKQLINTKTTENDNASKKDDQGYFDTSDIKLMKDFVTVVTAPRDQDDSTFTTKIVATIGAWEMKAGDTTIDLHENGAPAYISNDRCMLPLRAITKALSGSAIVTWDDATHAVTIIFGSRVITIAVGDEFMTINGNKVAMTAKAEITDSRVFLPIRDLGHALGLDDSKINWDAASSTATLN